MLEGARGVPWGTRRGAPVFLWRGTGLYGVALLLSAFAGFVAAPAAEPYLSRLSASAGPLLPGPPPGVQGTSDRPGPAGAADHDSRLRTTQGATAADLRSWSRWLVAQAVQVVWPAAAWDASGSRAEEAPGPRPPAPALQARPASVPLAPEAPGRSTPRPPSRGVWVAVYHTHASEMYRTDAFAPEDPQAYHRFGTADTGIVRVGAELVRALNEYGIPAVHLATLHDTPDFRSAYARSLETARTLVERYPSLRLLIDLHRDAPQEGGALITSVEGEEAAQIAIVVGTGDGGREGAPNLSAARLLADELEGRFPGLLRRIIVQPGRRYNQQVHPGALLIEIGSYRSREAAAMRTARLLAQAIAAMLLRHPFPPRVWG